MKLHVLMAQRKQRYEGEYGLEAIAVMSEADQESNPDYLLNRLAESRGDDEFEACDVVVLDVSEAAIRKVLFPAAVPIPAAVVAPA